MIQKLIQQLSVEIASQILNQPAREIGEGEALISSGLIDSFHLIDLALYVEDNFGVEINDSELNAETFDTLKELAELIQTRRN